MSGVVSYDIRLVYAAYVAGAQAVVKASKDAMVAVNNMGGSQCRTQALAAAA